MHFVGLARLGKDAVTRFLQDGTPVANLALAYNYGKKDDQGNRPTQWVEGVLWGDRAGKLAQYLVKGQQLNVHLSDVHTETYTTNDGRSGTKLVGRVDVVEFAGPRPEGQQAPAQQDQRNGYADAKGRNEPRNAPAPRQSAHPDMDDDIPF